MYKIAICDDQEEYLAWIEKRVSEYFEEHEIEVETKRFSDSDLFMSRLEEGRWFDAYILDVEMGACSGIDIANKIRERSDTAQVILLTAHAAYAVEACGMNIVRYVLKEELDQALPLALDELAGRLKRLEDEKFYVISNQRKYVKLPQKDIVYLYKSQKNTVFVLAGGTEEGERISMQKAYEKLDPESMVWLGRSSILNLRYVKKIEGELITMAGGMKLTSSKEHIAELKSALNRYWGERL